eukprot:TRINITY_DN9156_c1_g2_i1.p1 TRINITY_DN9156_c1_g2~~TRINITY_DN9156_c1_g2_i1.p1  ORF type:complete len:355 (+),score=122.42 TRINITY_DN9156_c1_g2_i1:193-1257(+)
MRREGSSDQSQGLSTEWDTFADDAELESLKACAFGVSPSVGTPVIGSPTGTSTPYEESTCEDARYLGDDMDYHALSDRLTEKETAQRHMLRADVSRIIESHWEGASVHAYGSFAYGLSTSTSPLDLVAEGCADLETTFHSVLKPLRTLLSVRRIMQEKTEAMLRATCPRTGLSVNISFFSAAGRSLPRLTARRLRSEMQRYPALRTVASVLRGILKLEGVMCFSTYHLLLMALPVCAASSSDDPGVVLVDFLDLYGQNVRFDECEITSEGLVGRDSSDSETSEDVLVLRDPVSNSSVATCVSAFDLNRLRIALRRRLNMLNDYVTCRSLSDSAFSAMMFSDCAECPAVFLAECC